MTDFEKQQQEYIRILNEQRELERKEKQLYETAHDLYLLLMGAMIVLCTYACLHEDLNGTIVSTAVMLIATISRALLF